MGVTSLTYDSVETCFPDQFDAFKMASWNALLDAWIGFGERDELRYRTCLHRTRFSLGFTKAVAGVL